MSHCAPHLNECIRRRSRPAADLLADLIQAAHTAAVMAEQEAKQAGANKDELAALVAVRSHLLDAEQMETEAESHRTEQKRGALALAR